MEEKKRKYLEVIMTETEEPETENQPAAGTGNEESNEPAKETE
jgi:hypothetical protein